MFVGDVCTVGNEMTCCPRITEGRGSVDAVSRVCVRSGEVNHVVVDVVVVNVVVVVVIGESCIII